MLARYAWTQFSWADQGAVMSYTMPYKGYTSRIGYDDEDGIFTPILPRI